MRRRWKAKRVGIGDFLMATGEAKSMQEADPLRRRVRILHQDKRVWSEVLDHNPRLARPSEEGDFLLHHARSVATNMRDYHTRKTAER